MLLGTYYSRNYASIICQGLYMHAPGSEPPGAGHYFSLSAIHGAVHVIALTLGYVHVHACTCR